MNAWYEKNYMWVSKLLYQSNMGHWMGEKIFAYPNYYSCQLHSKLKLWWFSLGAKVIAWYVDGIKNKTTHRRLIVPSLHVSNCSFQWNTTRFW